MKNMKKALACLLVAIMALTCFVGTLTVSAENATGSATVTGITVTEGATEATVKVTLTSDDAEGIHAAIVTLTSDFGTIKSIVDETKNFYVDADDEGNLIDLNDGTFLVQARSNEVNATEINLNVTFVAETAPAVGTYPVSITAGTVPAASWNEVVTEFTTLEGADIVVEAAEPEVKTFTTISNGASLEVLGLVQIKQYVSFDGLDATKEEIEANGGAIVWTNGSKPANDEDAVIGSGTSYTVELAYNGMWQGKEEYVIVTDGIPAAEYAFALDMRPYVVVDGEYYYGSVVSESVKAYCIRVFSNANQSKTLKAGLVGMLRYGSAAQVNFNVATDNLVDADLQTYVDNGWIESSYLTFEYQDSYIDDIVTPSDAMTANFEKDIMTDNGNSCELLGAVSLKQYFGIPDKTIAQSITSTNMYVWYGNDYDALAAAGTALTKDNASYSCEVEEPYVYAGSTYGYDSNAITEGIPAAELGKTVYIAVCATTEDGTEYCTGVLAHSPEEYSLRAINLTTTKESTKTLIKRMVSYGELMRIHFGK